MMAASVTTVAVLVFLSGFFIILFMNLNHFKKNLSSEIEIHAYLSPGLPERDGLAIKNQLSSLSHVASADYVSSEEALSRLRADVKNEIDLSGIMQNPLPSYISIKVDDPENIRSVADQITSIKGISDVNYLQKIVDQFVSIYKTLGRLFSGLVIFILICSLIIIHNTIRLGVFSRRNEIEIMQLVGASPAFIRWPFILEGAFYGLMGALIAVFFLEPSAGALTKKLAVLFPLLPEATGKELLGIMLLLLLLGTLVGSSGSYLSVNRYLE